MSTLTIPQHYGYYVFYHLVLTAKYPFGKGPQEVFNIEQTIDVLTSLRGLTVTRKMLESMLKVRFKGSDQKPARMVTWFIKNGIIG